MKLFERRFNPEEEKFSTQRLVTYAIILIFTGVAAWILFYGTVEQRSIIIQCIIGLMIGVVTFWIGSSKGAADNREQLNKLIPPPDATSVQVSTPSNVVVTTEEKPK